jgi:hypothetical protein
MSDHPLGLSADPFASPPTLSAEEASHLIQRLVWSCGGDGAALFPLATCAEIHRLTRGRLDAIGALAGKAMRVAAAEGASSVSPTHVRLALGITAPAEASGPSDAAAGATMAPIAPPTAADVVVPDLPASGSGAFALPSAPSEDLAPDTRDWVSRFIPADGSETAHGAASTIPGTPPPHDAATVGRGAPPGGADRRATASSPAASPGASQPSRRHRPHTRRWSRTESIVAASVAAIAIVYLAAIGLRQLPRENLHPAAPAPKPILPASGPALGSTTDAPDSPAVAHSASPAVLRSGPVPRATTRASVASVDSSPPEAPAPQLGLEVATFIVADRARAERHRLAVAGHHARLLTTWGGGSLIYRVVLGSFPSQAEAERAADKLLAAGTIQQARVVTLPPAK